MMTAAFRRREISEMTSTGTGHRKGKIVVDLSATWTGWGSSEKGWKKCTEPIRDTLTTVTQSKGKQPLVPGRWLFRE